MLSALLLCGLLALPPAYAQEPEGPARARAAQNLASLFSDEDYPAAAVRNGEEGPVGFLLSIDAEGKPAGCAVTSSSGSAVLDTTTCRLLMERARFTPARDSNGRATADELHGRIVWRLPDDEPPRLAAVTTLWMACLAGEAAKLVPGNLPSADIVTRAFAACTALEALFAAETDAGALERARPEMRQMIQALVDQTRAQLKAGPKP